MATSGPSRQVQSATSQDAGRSRVETGGPGRDDLALLPRSRARSRVSVLWLPQPPATSLLLPFADLHTNRGGRPDVVVLSDEKDLNLLTGWMSKAAAAVVPIINASGQSMVCADLSLAIASPETLELALLTLQPLMDRVRLLPEAYFRSTEPGHWLLARLATRERAAVALRDATSPSTFRYADQCLVPTFLACAERMCRSGFLDRHFFDRLNTCPACSGSRVLIREECRNCRSTNLVEEAIIHHLRCAYQGPERDFRDGQYLTCPKCRNRLEHFSVDYDKPGTLTVCNDCGHVTSEPAIGYLCIDCNSKGDSSHLGTRVIYSYELSERGREAVFSAALPLAEGVAFETQHLRRTVREFVAEHRALGLQCAILVIHLDAQKATAAGVKEDAFAAAADLFGEMLRETFTPETEILRAGLTFTVLISGDSPENIRGGIGEIREVVERNLAVDVGASYEVMTVDDFTLPT